MKQLFYLLPTTRDMRNESTTKNNYSHLPFIPMPRSNNKKRNVSFKNVKCWIDDNDYDYDYDDGVVDGDKKN
jgi:hypothetical protein